MSIENRGSIAFFTSYRPPVPLDIFSCPTIGPKKSDELRLTDGVSYNYNAQVIPPSALKTILKRPKFASEGLNASNVDSGMIFVSERGNLETLHISIKSGDEVRVFNFADVFGAFNGVRMEDSGCFAGDDYLVYVTTKDPAPDRRQPWTAVYKTCLRTGETDRLTPKLQADLSPSVSPSGKVIAVASFQRNGGWHGEIEDLNTAIFVMNIEKPFNRKLLIRNGGWPTWGSDDVLFFHRKVGENWGVFRVVISTGLITRVTPDDIDAITPAAIDSWNVAVVTIRKKWEFKGERVEDQYRHIEIFDLNGNETEITWRLRPITDHFNPFVIDGGKRIGYHRCVDILKSGGDNEQQFDKLSSPRSNIGVFRVSGVFPTFSSDGSKLAFVDNEFKAIWIADSQGLRKVYEMDGKDSLFAPVWNQNPAKDILYICKGPSFEPHEKVQICAIPNVSKGGQLREELTEDFNNICPSTNPDGTKLVFRSTRDGGDKMYKNLYIMENAEVGEFGDGEITRLTNGDWVDTHCQWSPSGDWIVFSSTRDKPKYAPETDNGLDLGYFAVFIVKWNDPSVVVRVMASGGNLAGHVNHPFFSPDGKSIVVTSDLAGVSVDPISLPRFVHSVRPYGDIFTVDIDENNIYKNKNVTKFERVTHTRFENSTGTWTKFATDDSRAAWNVYLDGAKSTKFSLPSTRGGGHRNFCPR